MTERGRAWWRGVPAWIVGLGVLALGLCGPLAGRGYWLDLAANLAAQGLIVGLAAGAVLAIRRRWLPLAGAVAGCLLMAWALGLPGRLLEWPAPGTGNPVRVLVFNSSTTRGDAGEAIDLISRVNAHVVVLTEPSAELLDRVRASTFVNERYPGYFLPERAAGGYMLVLSVWTQSPVLGDSPKDVARAGLRVSRIERPEGPFVLLAVHPDSPRSSLEWRRGNGDVDVSVALIEGGVGALGLPMVVAADLNSTPSGWRSRRLESTGLRRGKPVWVFGGTYPRGWPWPLSVAIDDVLVGGGAEVASWRRLEGSGSDHLPVLVELAIPGQPSGPAGR